MIRFIFMPFIVIGVTALMIFFTASEAVISVLAIPYAISEVLKECYHVQNTTKNPV